MEKETSKPSAPLKPEPALACRLRRKLMTRRGPASPLAGEVELENVSQETIEIEWTMHPLQHLSLVITDAAGSPVPATPYNHIFSLFSDTPQILRLAPGDKYVDNVGLLGGVPKEKQLPGTYTIQAVYRYKGGTAVSEPFQVSIPPAPATPTAAPLTPKVPERSGALDR
jgi:hypothetical protein